MAEVVVVDDAEAAGSLVARHIAARLEQQPALVLGVATGSTPLPVYAALADLANQGLDLSSVTALALDEYVGLPQAHPQSYRSVVTREVVEPLGLDPAKVHVPDGDPAQIETAGERFEQRIVDSGGVDVQILGIGTGGHIAFNEPGSSFGSLTRVKTLTEQTRRDNARFFDSVDDVPIHSVTQGLGTILRARHLILLAFGESKAAALAASVEGPVTASMPGSAIQLHHHVTVVVDHAAASELRERDYYAWAQLNKPAWQGI
ncbi:MAG: glucosamine-6-phosphate deaminase [Actinobacteria bacterium HGW-Actinobacteria-4]|nr:MAG: glucosamine-6-phosphate deaminase [Actinobacteria bacterium HGW-Actinobacteria-4]